MLASRVGGLSTECAGPAHSITVPSCCMLPCWPMPRYCRRPDKGATFSTESADFCLSRGAENGQKQPFTKALFEVWRRLQSRGLFI
ncbi:hypothetical protein D3C73_643230 [compost metagenome]